ncbi:cytosolic non-specific dipeptidase-like isoform X2 [Mizuhopecten yessoensis]|uniref:Cytosolic non-specific dipeptidase n=1 Tax=Mizuhopecten yessoensis TaxID=6573 RepID=A0A210R187_MIZYE|nr:cytosolic non-specific dipeptidase-like isoform X2 [Mizuhopecten yessoensis]OWF54759.1 Cytosolic non-specific dipeptidase [Mizuhopecten yessoensis]
MDSLFEYIDSKKEAYIQRLKDAVAIKSVSAWPETRGDITTMVKWTQKLMDDLGAETELKELGDQDLGGGSKIPLPPVLQGVLGKDPSKKTLLVYGHLDVQPARKEDGWDQDDPFKAILKDGKIYGRGSTDDKGPVLAWINCLEAMKENKMPVPVNLKFMFEGMEECGSDGLDDLVNSSKDTFLKDVDYVCISDNYWLGKTKPCVTYGLRGICYFFLEIDCSNKDLHSGLYGGTVHEAMVDLVGVLGTLVDSKGNILIPGIGDSVAELTEEERQKYDPIDFSPEEYQQDTGCHALIHDNKQDILMHRWRYPSLSIHGIEGAFSDTGAKTVIPRKVIGKFSVRLVPDQTPEEIERLVKKHVEEKFRERNSPNHMKLTMGHGGKPWVSDYNDPNFVAGRKAMKTVYGVEPDLTREGGSIPVTLTFQEATKKNVMLLPLGCSDDGAHSQNEKMDVVNYINGIKVMGAYMDELAKL